LPESASPAEAADRTAILITRPEPGASETAQLLRVRGLTPVLCPVLQVRSLTPVLPPALRIAGVLVTSGNAIPALPDAYHQLPLLAVGNSTADRARQAGFTEVTSADGDAQALAEQVRQRLNPTAGPLLLAAGRHNGDTLAADLRQAGYRVTRRVVYATEPVKALAPEAVIALRRGQIRVALFFSAETVRHFVRLVRAAHLAGSLQDVDAVAIGRSAGVALEALPWRRVRVAARPNQDEMLALL